MAASASDKIWYFEVTDPTNHPKGFTIYKVTAKVFPVNAPESLTEIVIWKRYNDFKELNKVLVTLHKSLHRRVEFPMFAKPKLFGRFEEQVIEERRSSALDLLNFIGQQPHLYRSQHFNKFLEGGKVVEGLSGLLLKPSRLDILHSNPATVGKNETNVTSRVSESSTQLSRDTSTEHQAPNVLEVKTDLNSEPMLEGVWKFPAVPDNISLNSYEDDTDVDSTLGTPLPDTDMAFFDPLASGKQESDESQGLHTSKSWILEAVNTCTEMENAATPVGSVDDETDDGGLKLRLDSRSDLTGSTTSGTLTQSTASQSGSTVDVSEFDPLTDNLESSGSKVTVVEDYHFLSEPANMMSGNSTSVESFCSNMSTPKKKTKKALTFHAPPGRYRSQTTESVSTMDLGSAGDYIHLAARQICLAQEFEANGEFEQAFATYKSCVGILLQGVQVDQNKGRRDAVRRKTAQYLMKAEELYNRHLAKDVSDEHRWAMESTLSPSTEVDPALTFLRAPASDLKKFKVLGTINKVILVLDKSTEETFVIKRVYKCSKGHNSKQNILPTLCPYMVNLHKFYETSNAVYLLLQYASGGKLWNYVGAYLRAAQEQNREGGTAGPGINENTPRQDFQNVYTGYKEHHDSNKRKSFLEAKPGLKAEEITKGGNTKLVDKVAFSKESDTVELNQQRLSPVKDLSVSDFQFDVTNKLETYSVDISDLIADSNQVSAIDVIPETSQSTTKTHVQYNRYTSFSSEENVEIENDSCSSIERQPSGGANFNDILEKNTKKAGLENFSINSFDSGDGITRVDSNMSENIEAIQEVNENSCDIDVFSCDIQHNPEYARNNDIDFTFGNVETSTGIKHSNQATHDHEQKNGNNSNKLEDGVETDTELDIVRNSKELLKAVERTLSQIDCDEKTRKDHDVSKTNGTQQVNNDKHTNAVSAALGMMGPSIYDLHCHGDSSNSQSDSGSGSRSLEDSQLVSLNSNYNEINNSVLVINEILSTVDTANNEGKDETRSRTSSDIILNRKLSLNRLNSAEFSRSASTDTEARSPTKTRQRTISMMFEQLDLTSQTSEQVKIPESFIRRWAAEMIVAVSRLHALGIICRELKPDNILLGDQGHATLTYFCQINQVPKSLDFEAVGNFYVAPEVIGISGYTETCDWWSLGALLYELLVGRSLQSCHPGGITSHTQLYMPDHLSQEAQSLLQQLLVFNPRERLGAGLHGVEEIKTHPFFNGIDWNSMDM